MTFSGSRRSKRGSAYLLRLAVKTTTSYICPTAERNSSIRGRLRTYTSTILPSISTGMMKSGSRIGLKEECTRVSSKSRTSVFFPMSFKANSCMFICSMTSGSVLALALHRKMLLEMFMISSDTVLAMVPLLLFTIFMASSLRWQGF